VARARFRTGWQARPWSCPTRQTPIQRPTLVRQYIGPVGSAGSAPFTPAQREEEQVPGQQVPGWSLMPPNYGQMPSGYPGYAQQSRHETVPFGGGGGEAAFGMNRSRERIGNTLSVL
jgi:hypothetical protein